MRTAPTLTVAVALLAVGTFSGVALAFTSFSPPLTGGTDFVTGAPTCGSGDGAAGVLFDSTHFFTTDYCSHATYRFPLTGGDFSSPEASAANGLGGGLAVSGSHYYGGSNSSQSLAEGVYSFDPVTLAVGPQIVSIPSIPKCTERSLLSSS